mmetsp:Transcript_31186/g.85496  ORF Transcript_31186/g.85496 Transcript_31186/m.85496 type:complete len:254 (-) Transcript_31186:103-864(-)
MLPTPKCSPPCSPELRASRVASIGSDLDLLDLTSTDCRLHEWGQKLVAGTRGALCTFLQGDGTQPADVKSDRGPENGDTRPSPRSEFEVSADHDLSDLREEFSPCGAGERGIPSAPRVEYGTVAPLGDGTCVGSDTGGSLRGFVIFRGNLAGGVVWLGAELQRALMKLLAPAAGIDFDLTVSLAQFNEGHQADGPIPGARRIDFAFEVTLHDASLRQRALEMLRHEADTGAKGLLPLPTAASDVVAQLELTSC